MHEVKELERLEFVVGVKRKLAGFVEDLANSDLSLKTLEMDPNTGQKGSHFKPPKKLIVGQVVSWEIENWTVIAPGDESRMSYSFHMDTSGKDYRVVDIRQFDDSAEVELSSGRRYALFQTKRGFESAFTPEELGGYRGLIKMALSGEDYFSYELYGGVSLFERASQYQDALQEPPSPKTTRFSRVLKLLGHNVL